MIKWLQKQMMSRIGCVRTIISEKTGNNLSTNVSQYDHCKDHVSSSGFFRSWNRFSKKINTGILFISTPSYRGAQERSSYSSECYQWRAEWNQISSAGALTHFHTSNVLFVSSMYKLHHTASCDFQFCGYTCTYINS